jgi:hypothetical protein
MAATLWRWWFERVHLAPHGFLSGWWFQTFFIFHNIWDKTTNQLWSFCICLLTICNPTMITWWFRPNADGSSGAFSRNHRWSPGPGRCVPPGVQLRPLVFAMAIMAREINWCRGVPKISNPSEVSCDTQHGTLSTT